MSNETVVSRKWGVSERGQRTESYTLSVKIENREEEYGEKREGGVGRIKWGKVDTSEGENCHLTAERERPYRWQRGNVGHGSGPFVKAGCVGRGGRLPCVTLSTAIKG